MRVVVDTNVLVRAASIAGDSPVRQLLRLLREPPHLLIISHFLLNELLRALSYERVRQVHGLDDAGVIRFVSAVEKASLLVTLPQTINQVAADPDDDPVLATAVVGGAEILCTRDRHFLNNAVRSHCATHGIKIMDDLDLLKSLRQDAPTD